MGLLERASVLDELERWLADARAAHGRVVLIDGEAGVGKTSLLSEFALRVRSSSHSRRARLLWGACDALTTPRPLGPLVDMAPMLGGRVDALMGGQQSTDHQGMGDDRLLARNALFSWVLDRLRDESWLSVLVIEDLHWADEATLDLLRFLARRIADLPVLVMVSYRDEDVGPAHPLRLLLGDLASLAWVHRLSLEPLSLEAVTAMARERGMDPGRLYTLTGGNPFYVTEVIAAGESDVPASIRDVVLARASRLSTDARRVLDVAAIVTPPLETWLLAEVAGTAADHLDECVAMGMLRKRPSGVEFRHELARLAVERMVPPGRAVDLHWRTLTALVAHPGTANDYTRLAHHAEGAGDAAAVLAYAIPAGRWASALGAHTAAAEQYDRARRFTAGLAPREMADLLERHSYECYMSDRADEAARSRELALTCWRVVGDSLRQGDSLRWLSQLAWIRGDTSGAVGYGEKAVELLARLPPGPELAMAYSNLALLGMLACDAATTVHWGQLATDLAESLGRMDILAHALNNVGVVEFFADPAAGREKLARSLALARTHELEEGVVRALNNFASICVLTHQFAEADRLIAEGIAYCVERDLVSWRMDLLQSRALSYLEQANWAAAMEAADEVLRDPRTFPITRADALVVVGRVSARRGEGGVWPPLEEALALSQEKGDWPRTRLAVAAAWAEAAWLAGDPTRALGLVQQTLASLPPEDDGAGGWAAESLEFWYWRLGQKPPSRSCGHTPFALQLAGDWAGAAAAWRELGCPYETALALTESGGPAELREAVAVLRGLGAKPAIAAVNRRLREMGARSVTRGSGTATRSNPANLTEREVEILNLVAEGLRNADIAGRLFISTKTVGNHISSIIAKLGVRSRGEAVARLAGQLGSRRVSRSVQLDPRG